VTKSTDTVLVEEPTSETVENQTFGDPEYRIPEYKPEQATPSPEAVQLIKDIEFYLRNEGGRAAAGGVLYGTNWRAMFEAGLFTPENTSEATNRTSALLRLLDREIERIALAHAGLDDVDYTPTDEEVATIKQIAKQQAHVAISPPHAIVQALLGREVLSQDSTAVGEFRRRARALGLDLGALGD
jgi:hypothetical protein